MRGQTPRRNRFHRVAGLVMAAVLLFSSPAAGAPPCVGDCGTDGTVTISDVIRGVNVALGSLAPDQCPAMDGNADRRVTVDELVTAVNNALGGCPSYVKAYVGTAALDAERRADIALTVQADGQASGTVTILAPATATSALGRAAALLASFAISGTVDLDTGVFSVRGSFVDGEGHTVEVELAGTLPLRPGQSGSFSFHLDSSSFSGSIMAGGVSSPSPTPTSTVPSGTVHHVTVGQPNLPFDPEFLGINPGDTVVWTWVGGPHSVVSHAQAAPGVMNCEPDGRFASPVQSSGTFSYTFDTVGEYEYHCGVSGHCQNFETGFILVNGTPTATATVTPTPPTVVSPTPTATPETVNGVATGMLGIFSGLAVNDFGGEFPIRLQILALDLVQVVELPTEVGNVLGGRTFTMTVQSLTRLSYVNTDPYSPVTLVLDMVAPGHVSGVYTMVQIGMGAFTIRFDAMREP